MPSVSKKTLVRTLLWLCALFLPLAAACQERTAGTLQESAGEADQSEDSAETGYSYLQRAGDLLWAYLNSASEHIDFSYITLPGEEPGDNPVEQREHRAHAVNAIRELEDSGVIEHLERFASLEFDPPPLDGPQSYHDELTGSTRSLARYLRARMVLAWHDRDWDRVVSSLRLGLALAETMLAQDGGVEMLTGVGIHFMIADEASDILMRETLQRDVIDSMSRVVDATQPPDLIDSALRWREVVEQDIRSLYATESELSTEAWADGALERFNGLAEGWHKSAEVASRSRCVERGRAFMEGWIANIRATASNEEQPFDADAFTLTLTEAETPARVIISTAHGSTMSALRTRMHHDGLILDVALAAFRAETGTYPESLFALMPKNLDELPRDPFSGEPYGYFRPPGLVRAGRSPYRLYSVGSDRVDNGGRIHPDSPAQAIQAWLPGSALRDAFGEADGFDYPLNLPN